MHLKKYSYLPDEDKEEIKWAFDQVREKLVAPSMRSMQFGGKAVEAHNSRLYNCATRHIDSIRSFAEVMYLLLAGCGVGYGITKKYINRLPSLVDKNDKNGMVLNYQIQDSIEGWADSIEVLLSCYLKGTPFTGRKVIFDYSRIRPKGSILKTGGGKAPGHEGLKQSLTKIKTLLDYLIENKNQSQLKPINAYDILMHLSDAVLSGGIRRSASIALFDMDDVEMINSKTNFKVLRKIGFEKVERKNGKIEWEGRVTVDTTYGGIENNKYEVVLTEHEYDHLVKQNEISWIHIEPQRARSNNSILLNRSTTTEEQLKNIISKIKQYGEPGFVFTDSEDSLVNPCVEINMIPLTKDGVTGVQFCNLTTQNGKKISSKEIFKRATKAATIIGTLQAGYTDFKYLSKASKEITETEALLGVSITGIMDNPDILLNPELQEEMAKYAVKVNKEWAKKIGIKQAARITCVKPEGTSSVVLQSSSGIHPHHARKYFRRIQCNHEDNVYKHFAQYNPHAIEPSFWSNTKTDDVITFPIEVSDKAIVKQDLTAIKHLKYALQTQKNWVKNGTTEACQKPIDHNVSLTVIVDDSEWNDVIKYIYAHKNYFTGISFLHKVGDKTFRQAPMEAVVTEEDQKKFDELTKNWKSVDYTKLKENEDGTTLQQEIACTGGVCELVKL